MHRQSLTSSVYLRGKLTATRTHPDPDNWIDVTYPEQDEFEWMVADRKATAARKTVP